MQELMEQSQELRCCQRKRTATHTDRTASHTDRTASHTDRTASHTDQLHQSKIGLK